MDTFYAFWNAEQVRDLFEVIVFICGGADFRGLLKAVALIGLLLVVTSTILRQRPADMVSFYFMLALFYGLLVVPKTTVIVRDVRTGANYVVANVSLGAAFVANVPSHVGYYLANTFEAAFIPANDTGKFSKFGMAFPERVVAAVQSLGAVTSQAREMINAFTKDCVIPEMIDSPAKANAVLFSSDIWGLVSSAGWVNPARMSVFPNGDTVPCEDAIAFIDLLLPAEYDEMKKKLGRIVVPEHPNPSAVVAAALPQAETLVLNMTRTFEDSMRQSVMLDAVPNGVSLAGASANSLAMAVNVAVSQANLTSTINYRAMTEIARDALPKVRSAVEFLLLGIFPIVVVMLVMGTGSGVVLKGYFATLVSVELWPALCAIINYLVVSYDASPMTQLIAAEGGNSLATVDLIRQFGATSQDVAGMLTLSVPLIAYALVSAGGYAATSMFSGFMQPAGQTAQQMGSQLAAGNMSFGNVSWGNINSNSRSANLNDGSIRETTGSMATVTDAFGSDTYASGGGAPVSRASASSLGPFDISRSATDSEAGSARSGTQTEGAFTSSTSSEKGLAAALTSVNDAGYAQRVTAAYNIVSKSGDEAYMREGFSRDASTVAGREMTTSDAYTWLNQMSLSGDISAGLKLGKLLGKGGAPATPAPPQPATGSSPALGGATGGTQGPGAPTSGPAQGQVPVGTASRTIPVSPAISAGGTASATGQANKANVSSSASRVGSDQRTIDSKDFGAAYAATLLVDAGSGRQADQQRGQSLRASLDEMHRMQEASTGSTTTRMSGGEERSKGTTVSTNVVYGGASDAYGGLTAAYGSRAEARRALAQGDPRALGSVGNARLPGSPENFADRVVQAPQPASQAANFGAVAQGAAASGSAGVRSFYDAGVRRVESFVGAPELNDVKATPADIGAWRQYAEGARSYFKGQREAGARQQDAQVGMTVVAAALDGQQFRGGLSSLKLAGEAIGVSAFRDGHQFLDAVNRVMANRDAEPLAAAAIQDFGARVKAGNVSEADVRQFAEAVRPAIGRVMKER